MIKEAKTKYAVNELIKKRWSPRSFSDQTIPEEILFSLFEAASWAASSRNEQPWRFICGIKGNGENYDKIFSTLAEGNQKWAETAPVLVIGCAKTHFDLNNKPNFHAFHDLGQALANLFIQAISYNIYTHPMGGFDKDLTKEIFNISEAYEPVVAIAIGYLGLSENLPDDLKESEEKPRTRNDLGKILFLGDPKL